MLTYFYSPLKDISIEQFNFCMIDMPHFIKSVSELESKFPNQFTFHSWMGSMINTVNREDRTIEFISYLGKGKFQINHVYPIVFSCYNEDKNNIEIIDINPFDFEEALDDILSKELKQKNINEIEYKGIRRRALLQFKTLKDVKETLNSEIADKFSEETGVTMFGINSKKEIDQIKKWSNIISSNDIESSNHSTNKIKELEKEFQYKIM